MSSPTASPLIVLVCGGTCNFGLSFLIYLLNSTCVIRFLCAVSVPTFAVKNKKSPQLVPVSCP